jgi:hypothetical protein
MKKIKIDLWTKFQYSISKTVGCPHFWVLNILEWGSPFKNTVNFFEKIGKNQFTPSASGSEIVS